MAAAACAKRPLQLTLALLKPDAVAHPLVLEVRADRAAPHRSAPSGRPGGAPPPSRCASAHRPCMRPSSATASSSCAPRSCAAGGSRAAAFTGSTRVGGAGLRRVWKEKILGVPVGSSTTRQHCALAAQRAN